jgi:hypothetical protein
MPWRLHVPGICCVTFYSDAVGLHTWRHEDQHNSLSVMLLLVSVSCPTEDAVFWLDFPEVEIGFVLWLVSLLSTVRGVFSWLYVG